jgi:hypothetical protein
VAVERVAELAVGREGARDRPEHGRRSGDGKCDPRAGADHAGERMNQREYDDQPSPIADPVRVCNRIQACAAPASKPEVVVPCS